MPQPQSPVSPQAARMCDIFPSEAVWTILTYEPDEDQFVLDDVGQFTSGFYPDPTFDNILHADFVTTHGRRFVRQYTASCLSMSPIVYGDPTAADTYLEIGLLRGPGSSAYWSLSFAVKLQRAHKAIGCQPVVVQRTVRTFTERNRRSLAAGQTMPYDENGLPHPLLTIKRGG